MPAQPRFKTKYPGVSYVEGVSPVTGKPERVYYIRYRKDSRLIEEKAGRQFQDDMTPARAAGIRATRIRGLEKSNEETRLEEEAAKKAEDDRWAIARLWEEYKRMTPDLKGIITDENRFNIHITAPLGHKEPKELVPLDVDRLRLKTAKKHQQGTVKNVLELVRRIVNYGVKKQLCEGPSFKIELPTVHNCKTEDLTPEQLSALLAAIDEEPNIQAANFMRLVLFTGMRRGELFKLKWSHVDFDRGFINIIDPKGGPSQKIPLNASARDLLESHPRSASEYVFPGRHGGRRVDIKKQANRIKERAGLPKDFRALHGLRHVYASMLASSGEVDMYTLQKLLTHKSPMMTQRYAHLRDEALKRASELAGDIINQAVTVGGREQGLRLAQ